MSRNDERRYLEQGGHLEGPQLEALAQKFIHVPQEAVSAITIIERQFAAKRNTVAVEPQEVALARHPLERERWDGKKFKNPVGQAVWNGLMAFSGIMAVPRDYKWKSWYADNRPALSNLLNKVKDWHIAFKVLAAIGVFVAGVVLPVLGFWNTVPIALMIIAGSSIRALDAFVYYVIEPLVLVSKIIGWGTLVIPTTKYVIAPVWNAMNKAIEPFVNNYGSVEALYRFLITKRFRDKLTERSKRKKEEKRKRQQEELDETLRVNP